MRRYLALLMVAGLAATLAGPSEAGAGQSTQKPKNPPSSRGSQSSGGQQANLDTHAHQAAANVANRLRTIHNAGRELVGEYQWSNDRNNKLPEFDGAWFKDNIGQTLIAVTTNQDTQPPRLNLAQFQQASKDLLARGISILPEPTQLAALQAYIQDPIGTPVTQLLSYYEEISLNRGFRNTQIEQRAPQNVYDKVDASQLLADDYERFETLLQHNGPNGNDHANRYIPASAALHH